MKTNEFKTERENLIEDLEWYIGELKRVTKTAKEENISEEEIVKKIKKAITEIVR